MNCDFVMIISLNVNNYTINSIQFKIHLNWILLIGVLVVVLSSLKLF